MCINRKGRFHGCLLHDAVCDAMGTSAFSVKAHPYINLVFASLYTLVRAVCIHTMLMKCSHTPHNVT